MGAMNMDGFNPIILSLVTFTPAVGGLLILLIPRRDRDIKVFALVVSTLAFVASLHLPVHLHRDPNLFKFEINKVWITNPNIHYHMGIDGISVWLVVLTTFLTPLCVLISWTSIHVRVKEFFILLLIMESALIGVFTSLDLFLFYFFWESTLVPMALLIGIYGHGRKVYAAVKYFLFTFIGSMFMLAAILWLYAKTGTFDFVEIQKAIHSGNVPGFEHASLWLFLGFFIAFAVKVPLFPVHTWLPDAHVEAPTAGSVLLAGVLLKMGTYGLLRFNVGLFREEARRNASWIMALALIGIIYGALVALVQPNMKKLIAYSSISHLGFVVLGIFSFTAAGLNGAVFIMLAHGVATGGLFMLAGILYERRHTYEITEFGGLATPMPRYATFFLVTVLASVGLPLLNGFIGEFLVLSGAFQARPIYGVLAATGVIWSACYLLWMYQRVFFGQVKHEVNNRLPDLNVRERAALAPIAIAALVMGVAPMVWLGAIDPAVQSTLRAALTPVTQLASKMVGQ
ncbi:MAG TPA: NADH-quinone oxidoreductase subunit M [Terriglobales bacterium]|jgi:NADH-quinone oxidoreductase subunit M|nr:NADH-quinone oxidoreductase subunit M [Terriglobales bacterium]